jgi:hypothetical protein
MNNFQRLEINLLPPEMAPGPAIRPTTIFNVLLIMAALFIIGLNLVSNLSQINTLSKTVQENDQKILQQQPIVEEYMALKEIKDNTEGRGKLVGMASATYVEYPVILDRVSRLLPDGVYLTKASSGGGAGRGDKEIILEFNTATSQAELMNRTLEAFKTSPMFRDVYLRTGNFRPQPLDEVGNEFNIPWRYSSPNPDDAFVTQSYNFEIRAQVNSPLEVDDLVTVLDKSELMLPFELTTDPSAAAAPPAPANSGAAPQGNAAAAPTAGGAS